MIMNKKPLAVFADFDGTLTLANGKLSHHLFELIDLLNSKEIPLIINTGRSVGWGLFILSHFDVSDVIVENGSVHLSKEFDENGRTKYLRKLLVSDQNFLLYKKNLKELKQKLPDLKFSLDSSTRLTDHALEIEHLTIIELDKLKEKLAPWNFSLSESNIHLHLTCGDHNKKKAMDYFCEKKGWKVEDVIFFGDSYNDECVFEHYPRTVGVANIDGYIPNMNFLPNEIMIGADQEGVLGVLHYMTENF